ncbi:ribosome assembly RNA-binding protein YhbY [Sporosarcina gallistercoris]|uniref:Ribosome assembly RNA-binding protein YhbY n=1 Tax=Sporosarcina gallistercoris TaxID=2762245 RepID=A0ABR8PFD5_9BACL|nr:ribosome assembly RNA-binding protein YhbY [Sporosarcina gallistercoris]MBD7906887.1 ribosome assembly RNA-binding protein YhbY [Sporosarcina gallistercoris]
MLTSKQKSFLRSEAHHLQPIFQIGKSGMTDAIIKQIEEALEARELIKLSVLQNCEQDKEEIADILSQQDGFEVVQIIGKTIILYKESKEKKKIVLP